MSTRTTRERAASLKTAGDLDAVEAAFWRSYGLRPIEHFVNLESAGTRLRVQEVGKGHPVIFVHGTGGSGTYFAPLIAQLEGFRCLVLDRPGWGLSEPVDFTGRDYSELVVEILQTVLDGFGVEHAHAVGGSVGDLWVLRLAQVESSPVEKMVWLGSTALEELGVPRFIKLLASPLGLILARLGEREWVMRKQLPALGHGTTLESGAMDRYLHWRAVEAKDTHFLRHERKMVIGMQQEGEWAPGIALAGDDFRDTSQPTLLVYGSHDPLGTVELWQRKIDLMQQGRMEVIDDSGHLPWYDEPRHVANVVQQFLDR